MGLSSVTASPTESTLRRVTCLSTVNAGAGVAGSTFTLTGEDGTEVAVLYFDGSKFSVEGSTAAEGAGAAGATLLLVLHLDRIVGYQDLHQLGGAWSTTGAITRHSRSTWSRVRSPVSGSTAESSAPEQRFGGIDPASMPPVHVF